MRQSHTHDLEYLWKSDDEGNFVGRVLQLPGLIVQGESKEEIREKIKPATEDYLRVFPDEDERILKDPTSKYTDSGYGRILGIEPFKITC